MNQNVQTVEAQKPENSNTKTVNSVNRIKPPIFSIDLKKFDPQMLKTVESFGVPINGILEYVDATTKYNIYADQKIQELETKMNAVLENFEPAVKQTVLKMVEEERSKLAQTQPTQAAPALGSPTLQTSPAPTNQLMAIIASLLQNPQAIQGFLGTVTNSSSTELQGKLNELMLASVNQKIAEITNPPPNIMEEVGRAVVNQITAKMGSKVATQISTALEGV